MAEGVTGPVLTTTVQLQTPSGTISVRLEVPDGPCRAVDIVPCAQVLADTFVEMARRTPDDAHRTFSCRKGCNACCTQLVPVAEQEIRAISSLVERMPEPRRSEVRARFDGALSRLADAGILDSLRTPPNDDPTAYARLLRDYFALGIECPFLSPEGCGIHGERPTICREYNVVSDPIHCADPWGEGVEYVGVRAHVALILARACETLNNRTPKITPLVLALEWVHENPDEGEVFQGVDWLRAMLLAYEELTT